jgi:hypothetical protein
MGEIEWESRDPNLQRRFAAQLVSPYNFVVLSSHESHKLLSRETSRGVKLRVGGKLWREPPGMEIGEALSSVEPSLLTHVCVIACLPIRVNPQTMRCSSPLHLSQDRSSSGASDSSEALDCDVNAMALTMTATGWTTERPRESVVCSSDGVLAAPRAGLSARARTPVKRDPDGKPHSSERDPTPPAAFRPQGAEEWTTRKKREAMSDQATADPGNSLRVAFLFNSA